MWLKESYLYFVVQPDEVDGQIWVELAHELSAGAAGADVSVGEVGGDGDGGEIAVALMGK